MEKGRFSRHLEKEAKRNLGIYLNSSQKNKNEQRSDRTRQEKEKKKEA
jgi:hypothetical protein